MAEARAQILVLASGDRESGGGGSTLARVIEGTQSGELNADIGVVVCNNPPGTVGVYEKVEEANKRYGLNIVALTINGITHPGGKNARGQTNEEAAAICKVMADRDLTEVLALGYMKQVNGELVDRYGYMPEFAEDDAHGGIYLAHIINTHPGILPQTADTHGEGASAKAIELGLSHTAHTLHLVADGIDTGPTIAQNLVELRPGEDAEALFARVQAEEKAKISSDLDAHYKALYELQTST